MKMTLLANYSASNAFESSVYLRAETEGLEYINKRAVDVQIVLELCQDSPTARNSS